ncbi:MAG: hypothetical protein ACYTEX_11115 [Planctomycetota bacterium]|jgi:hypothetical protein
MTNKNHSTVEDALAYFTDCQIATYGGLTRGCSTARRKRHKDIALLMLEACERYNVRQQDLELLQDRFERIERWD